jgi:hypothetical protein
MGRQSKMKETVKSKMVRRYNEEFKPATVEMILQAQSERLRTVGRKQ